MQYYSLEDVILPPVTKGGHFEILGQKYPDEKIEPYCLSCSNPLQIRDGKLTVLTPQKKGIYLVFLQLVAKSGLRVTKVEYLAVSVTELSTSVGIALDL